MELLLPKIAAPAPRSPSYVKLDMAFGVGAGASLFDKSRYRSHGAITTAAWAAGLHGYCLDFVPGNPDYVVIPAAHAQLDFTVEDFSIIIRVKFDNLAANVMLFTRGASAVDGYYLWATPAGIVYIRTSQALVSQTTGSAGGTVVIATWYTIGISRTGATITVFVDGVDVTAIVGVHINPATSSRSAKIGIYDDRVTSPFDGKIEFLRIFGGIALAASEHLAWHRALA